MEIEFLQIEVEILLLKYGETAVLKALSSATASNERDLRGKISALKEKKSANNEKHESKKATT